MSQSDFNCNILIVNWEMIKESTTERQSKGFWYAGQMMSCYNLIQSGTFSLRVETFGG